MSARPRRHRGWLAWSAQRLVAHHEALGVFAPRYQWVWGLGSWALYASGAWPRVGSAVYRWCVRIGPLELRRWAT